MATAHYLLAKQLKRLDQNEFFSMRLGLERINKLCSALGNPQEHQVNVQIVGSNGKGTTTYYLMQFLQACGLNTGSFYSPHLKSFTERIRVNGDQIDQHILAKALEKVIDLNDMYKVNSTYFEIATATAFEIYQQENIDVAIMETGLGGRYDATTVSKARWGVITSIDLEHQQILGETIEEIAREKALAFKHAKLVISMPQTQEVTQVLREVLGKKLLILGKDCDCDGASINQFFKGAFHAEFWGPSRRQALQTAWVIAKIIAEELLGFFNPQQENFKFQTVFPGRLHVVENAPYIILDTAHNPSSVQALLEAIDELQKIRPLGKAHIVFGAMQDKDVSTMVNSLSNKAASWWLPTIKENKRALEASKIKDIIPDKTEVEMVEDLQTAIEKATKAAKAKKNDYVLACGSSFLVGPILDMFQNN